jgi:Zn-dependent protease with chaperone function
MSRSAVAVLLPALLMSACTSPERADAPVTCQTPAGARELDTDPQDSPETPWPKRDGQELVVHFETDGLTERYARMVSDAARIWSSSPCLRAIAVSECPDDGNCVAVKEEFSGGRSTDGEFTGFDSDGTRTGGRITLYTRLLNETSDNGALATTGHELGHALGLVHRQHGSTLMNATTDDKTNPVPDGTDFYNLAVIYGAGA